jgi:hypothetical protein
MQINSMMLQQKNVLLVLINATDVPKVTKPTIMEQLLDVSVKELCVKLDNVMQLDVKYVLMPKLDKKFSKLLVNVSNVPIKLIV